MKRLLAIGCAVLTVNLCGLGWGIGAEARPEESVVNFTFDAVDVQAFVKLVGELTGKRFVVGDGIKGKITVVSPDVRRDEVYPLFLSILESVGCSVLEDGGLLRVVSLSSRTSPLGHVVGPGSDTPPFGVITKVIRLQHVSAPELKKVLESKGGDGAFGGVSAIDETNQLIITDTVENVARVEALIAEIDLPGMARVTEIVTLSFASAGDMAAQLNDALEEHATRAEKLRQRLGTTPVAGSESRTASVVAAPHSNSLIIVGTVAQVQSLRELIEKMDVDVPSGRGRLNAIFLHHVSAEEAAENINALLTQKVGTEKDKTAAVRNIAIQASPSNNALLVDASPGDFDVVKRLIAQLDVAPEQVHINVLIMEISNGEGFQLGVELAAVNMPSGVGDSVVQGGFSLGDSASTLLSGIQSGAFPSGLSVGVARGTSTASDGTVQAGYPGVLNLTALKQNSRFKVVSETSLQTQNNKEANVSVVNEYPILKSEIQGGSGASRDVIQNIERLDVGVKLKITPHVIPGGRVRMELNPSIEAVIDDGPDGTQFAPTIAKRQVETTVIVDNGRTIVIAGLTRQDELESVRRVPILGSIPLLGWLFRRTQTSSERTDVLIFVTPTVVSEWAAADEVRKAWEEKTGLEKDGD